MPVFKAAVHAADRNKTKGDWIIRPKQNAPRTIYKSDRCRLFELPAELRLRIYELVFGSTTVVFSNVKANDWRMDHQPRPGKHTQVIKCVKSQDNSIVISRTTALWKKSLSAILLLNKQAHREATPELYKSCVFLFEPFKLARAFLRFVDRADLEKIGSIKFHHVMQGHGGSIEARDSKVKADLGFANMCQQFVAALPNLHTLEVRVQLVERPDQIVPDFSDPSRTFSVKYYQKQSWFQSLMIFGELQKLKEVGVHFMLVEDERMRRWFATDSTIQQVLPPLNPILGPSLARQEETIMAKWLHYYKALYRSMGIAVDRAIMGRREEQVWTKHLQKLKEYQAFSWDPLKPVAVTMASADYQAQMLAWDMRYGRMMYN